MRTFGVEREWFIVKKGKVVPAIGRLLPKLRAECSKQGMPASTFHFELFAGQVEDRTIPVDSKTMALEELRKNESILKLVGSTLDLDFLCIDYVSESSLGHLVVNPFDERHQSIWKSINNAKKVAASQVAALHIHIGVTIDEAVKVINYCREEVVNDLCRLGDFSNGARLRSYRAMAGISGVPSTVANSTELLERIHNSGGEKNVWDLVRYKPSTGTIEFRMFGAVDDYEKISEIITACESVLGGAL